MAEIRTLHTADPDFWSRLDALLAWEAVSDQAVKATVDKILADVRQRGDRALLEYTRRFDDWPVERPADLEIPRARLNAAPDRGPADQRAALEHA